MAAHLTVVHRVVLLWCRVPCCPGGIRCRAQVQPADLFCREGRASQSQTDSKDWLEEQVVESQLTTCANQVVVAVVVMMNLVVVVVMGLFLFLLLLF
jgi:hypothetical protein